MGKNKLAKFDDMTGYPHVFQYPFDRLREEGFNLKGHWNERFFKNASPIILELGCGKGEYTVGLGRLFPDKNFIGVDIKGARMWSGAKESQESGMTNVAFLRTHIEWITSFFAAGEVAEIWLTFPDPQMKKRNKRLTSAYFMAMYYQILIPGGIIHLKTDSRFMYAYTTEMVRSNRLPVLFRTDDLYHCEEEVGKILSIRTYYEQQWLDRGINITYICFVCEKRDPFIEPEIEIEQDAYRSFNRSRRSAPASGK
ncbi:MAG: tRNA (guanosine(46)-N7)-methyltransferase TrmB [Tannerellaceae bacterium]|jgi:tRNA (guanine-N7-)-methyltransferase|nr:tRNA (guanosine(46)-N7)-methyltransferase TrmB [Tannerellaceae bacterium]